MTDSFLKYLEYEKRLSRHTILAYKVDLQQFSDFISIASPGSTPASTDYGMIRAWIIDLMENGLEPRSVNRKIACLRTFYKFLLRQELISSDPMMKIKI